MPKYKAPEIADKMRTRIQRGEWSTAIALPNERALAEEFGVARNTIRNAFKALESEGLISRHVGRGTLVAEKASDELVRILDKISGASPLDILNLRLIIEPQSAATAASTASNTDLEQIMEADRQAVAAHDLKSHEYWDNEFHRRIFAATRNEFLLNLYEVLAIIRYREQMMDIRRRAFSEEKRLIYCSQHVLIINALQARDAPAAAQAMRTHLLTRRRNYFGE
jgi:DNA-binding FadR family transcriptional regulator